MKDTQSQSRRRRLAQSVGALDAKARAHVVNPSAYNLAEFLLAAIEYAAAVEALSRP